MWRMFIWFLTWLSADPDGLDIAHARSSAAISAARASMNPTPATDCCGLCEGGVITHQDGHTTICPCPEDCPCKECKECGTD